MTPISKSFQFGKHSVALQTGVVARQASGSVMVNMGGTVVMVNCTGRKEVKPGQDFFPLTVNYQERTYAAGKIPGSFFKREGRPSEKETLTSRLIDRPLRPLFPAGFKNEVQVVATVMSLNPEVDPDIPALIGASAAVAISGIPFAGPLGACRVGYIAGEYVLNPNTSEMDDSQLDLVVAGTDSAVLMVESEADILSEETMLGAVVFGHEQLQIAAAAIGEFAAEVGTTPWEWSAPEENVAVADAVEAAAANDLNEAYQIVEKQQRYARVGEIKSATLEKLAGEDSEFSVEDVLGAFGKVEKNTVRNRVLDGAPRIDGRDHTTVRGLDVRVGILPRTHGSSMFTRGETQAIVVATLGTERDAQRIDTLGGEQRDNFMLHYNFPPYCVGETGMVGSPKRREIGHGRLARRGIQAVLPSVDDFGYTMRVVSEITESNGSSSMASVCGTSLALMDAGVPLKAPVAGIAMGLVLESSDRFAVLTDILGDEDHLGDMDFKVAGSEEGITALQMDIKIQGITPSIMEQALEQAKAARLSILSDMNAVISRPRSEISEFAPRNIVFKIPSDKIRDVIGKGGATIRALTEETGCTIDLADDGTVTVWSTDKAQGEGAVEKIKMITAELEVGAVYSGKVTRILDFGAIVEVLPGKDGLVHISQIKHERVNAVADELSEGQEVNVKVVEVDRQGRVRLSIKETLPKPEAPAEASE